MAITRNKGLGWWMASAAMLHLGTWRVGLVDAKGPPPLPPQSYLVVATGLDEANPEHRAFRAVAERAASFHHGEVVAFDGADFDALRALLLAKGPAHVLFVLPPERLDVALHRRILLTTARLDEDPFVDVAFGYFTACDGVALEALWQRTQALHEKGLASKRWLSTFVADIDHSLRYAEFIPAIAKAAGFTGDGFAFACVERERDVLGAVDRRLAELSEASVLEFTGNGDPEGIWLFDGRRNADRTKHWPFDPARVGEDPNGEMPRVTAERVRSARLSSPIVWSGTCHSGATQRVFVEGDIVSTFGIVSGPRLYRMAPERSLALALIDAGATALLVPIAANHGMSVSREVDFALREGASLGDAVRSSWNDVMLAANGPLVLDIPVDGAADSGREKIMQGGGANRILIGDPALRPFASTPHPLETVETRSLEPGRFEVTVTWKKGFHPWAWDMYGDDRSRDWRVLVRVPLEALEAPANSATFDAIVKSALRGENAIDARVTRAVVEQDRGRRWLHLQANMKRTDVDNDAITVVFEVTQKRPTK